MSTLRISQGLNVLAGISKSVKAGRISKIPAVFKRSVQAIGNSELQKVADSVEQGANAVLSEVGINPAILSIIGLSTNTITTLGRNAAQSVFSAVINGNFGFGDNTEATQKPFEDLTDLIGNTQSGTLPFDNKITTPPSPYAVDKSSFNNHPKFKFLFIAEFIFHDDFQQALNENANNMAFVVKTASRPNVNIEYEDINMYNFKTKVAKSTEYQPVQMSFFDDQSNQTTSFYKKYLELLIPNMGMPESSIEGYESSSFNFSDDRDVSPFNSSNLQPLSGKAGHKNIIKSIRLFHIWGWGQYVNVYKFYNPKITEINLADLDMESSDMAEIQIQFSYDGLNIQTTTDSGKNISLDSQSPDSGGYNVSEYSAPFNRGKYPIHYNGDSSASKTMNGNNLDLPTNLKKKSLDIWDFTNPNAPDSDFRPELLESNSFPDFGSLLSNGINTATNLISNVTNLTKITNTINTVKSVFGDILPNINGISRIFGDPRDLIKDEINSRIGGISVQTDRNTKPFPTQKPGSF